MSYQLTLEKAGCEILAFNEFGCYQGTWLALVKYKGETGIVQGYYGSCSYCDSFQSAFERYSEYEADGKFYIRHNEVTKEQYHKREQEKEEQLKLFGENLLSGGLYKLDHYKNRLETINEEDWFDDEEKQYIEWAIEKLKEIK